MSSRGAGAGSSRARQLSAADAIRAGVTEQHRLTQQDRVVIGLLAEHGVLTADQIARLVDYSSLSVAQHRLATLERRHILTRFRAHIRPGGGSQAYRYCLGPVGAILHATTTGQPRPSLAQVAERALAIASSPRLGHALAVAEVFAALAGHARLQAGCALEQWWGERRATHEAGQLARPDGAGVWAEHGRQVGFWLELDRGTETLTRLAAKLTGYRRLAELTEPSHIRPVLIIVPTTLREHHLHNHLDSHPALRVPGLRPPVATTAAEHLTATSLAIAPTAGPTPGTSSARSRAATGRGGLGPADAVWLVPGARHRVRLIDLGGQP